MLLFINAPIPIWGRTFPKIISFWRPNLMCVLTVNSTGKVLPATFERQIIFFCDERFAMPTFPHKRSGHHRVFTEESASFQGKTIH